MHVHRSVGIWTFTTASAHIRAWQPARPTRPTLVHRCSAQLRKFAAGIEKVIERARETACGFVDNASALPTDPQAPHPKEQRYHGPSGFDLCASLQFPGDSPIPLPYLDCVTSCSHMW